MTEPGKPSSLRRFFAIITHPALALALVPFFVWLWFTMPHTPRDGWAWVKVPFVPKAGLLGGVADPAKSDQAFINIAPPHLSARSISENIVHPGDPSVQPIDKGSVNVSLYRGRTGLWIIDRTEDRRSFYWYLRSDGTAVPEEKRKEYLRFAAEVLATKGPGLSQIAAALRREVEEVPEAVVVDPLSRSANIGISVLFVIMPVSLVRLIAAGHRRWRAWRNPDLSKCRQCGYSLVGLVDRRCPECGSAAQTA